MEVRPGNAGVATQTHASSTHPDQKVAPQHPRRDFFLKEVISYHPGGIRGFSPIKTRYKIERRDPLEGGCAHLRVHAPRKESSTV